MWEAESGMGGVKAGEKAGVGILAEGGTGVWGRGRGGEGRWEGDR